MPPILDNLGKVHADRLADERQARKAFQKRYRISLGDWHCVGPFKNDAFGGLFESFEHPFAPEKDALDAGGVPNLKKQYVARKFPGMLDTERPWKGHPEWVDGYRHLLPRGPAPSRFETVYLYRTIRTAEAVEMEMTINAEDHIGAWLNGQMRKTAVRAERQPSRYPAQLRIPLNLGKGTNHLLVKITSMWGRHGFAFGLKGVTPYSALRPLAWSPAIVLDPKNHKGNFTASNKPWFTPDSRRYETPVPEGRTARMAIIAKTMMIPQKTAERILEAAKPRELERATQTAIRFNHALARLASFRGRVAPIPMFSPADYGIEDFRAGEPATASALVYLSRLKDVTTIIDSALAARQAGEPDYVNRMIKAEAALEAMWDAEIRRLPPIVFLKCPHMAHNAVRPCDYGGVLPASICIFNPADRDNPLKTIFHQADMKIFDFNLSFDAKTIFFSAKSPETGQAWQIFEIGINGKGLKQITQGPHNNISPCEMPNGNLIFVSTRNHHWVTCQGGQAGILFSCRRDGSGVKLLSANIDSDHTPQVMHDGRILFTRWDYGIEKNVFARHALWTINPDGSNLSLFFGNTIEDPAGFWQARPVPGRPEIIATFGPHHSGHAGMLGIIWPRNGTEEPRGRGFRFITREIPVYCDTTFHFGYQDPYPLNERQFLVSYGGDGGRKNRLYLMDDRGNRKCIIEAEDSLCCYNPQPLIPRTPPPAIPDMCGDHDWQAMDPVERSRTPPDHKPATLMVQDVYKGIATRVRRGEAASIQIMEQLRKTTQHRLDAWGTSPLMGRGTVHVRRLIGTVPVEADGSAFFTVPPLRNISLNLLDRDGKILMRMGSDMHVMPGESRSCVGCHEVRHGDTAPLYPRSSLALKKPPAIPEKPAWGNDGIMDYQKLIQPIWDKYCIACHSGPNPKGQVDMTGDRTRYFCMSYDNLIERELVDYHNVFALGHDENTPKSLGSYVSRIAEFIDTDEHCGKRLSADEKRLIYTWIDANVPYYSTYQFSRPESRGSRDGWDFSKGMFTAFDQKCMGCHRRKVYASALYGGWLNVSSSLWRSRGYSAHGITWRWIETPHIGPELRINLTNPSHSALLQAPLAKEAGGWGLCRSEDGKPFIFPDKTDPAYRLMLRDIEASRRKLVERPRLDMSSRDLADLKEKVLLDMAEKRGIQMLADKAIMDMVGRGTYPMLKPPENANDSSTEPVEDPLANVQNWLRICSEAVYGTRPFTVPGEGPHAAGAAIYDANVAFTHADLRFRRNSDDTVLYVIAFGWPGNGAPLNIATLDADDFDAGGITSITLLGTADRLDWKQDDRGLKVTMPAKPSYDGAYPLKITFRGVIPTLAIPMMKNDTDASITYSGSWRKHSLPGCFNTDETFTAKNNDHAVIRFKGTSISILSRVNPHFGTFKVFIDWKHVADVSTYSAKPADQQRVYTRKGLPDAHHTLKIVKTSGAWIGIDGFETGAD